MFTLSLDLSTKDSGYAVGNDDDLVESGDIKAKGKELLPRIIHMTKEIRKILDRYPEIEKVIIEDVRVDYKNAKTYKALSWLQGQIAIMLYEFNPNIEIIYFQPSSWRARIGIKIGPSVKREELKQRDINYVKEHYGLEVGDDEADAICLFSAYNTKNSFFIE